MEKKNIDLIFNIVFLLFIIIYLSFEYTVKFLFSDESSLQKIALIDRIFESSMIMGIITLFGVIIIGIILLFIQALFIKLIWSRLISNIFTGVKQINFQEALTIVLLFTLIFGMIAR